MDNRSLLALLKGIKACPEAIVWIEKEKLTLEQAWNKCDRADWLIWFADRTKMATHQEVVLTACAWAETTLKYVPKGKDRPRKAIEAARRWALDPTEENRIAAREATYATANAAACAACAAADAVAYAVAYAAYTSAQEKLCKIVRKMIKLKKEKRKEKC